MITDNYRTPNKSRNKIILLVETGNYLQKIILCLKKKNNNNNENIIFRSLVFEVLTKFLFGVAS